MSVRDALVRCAVLTVAVLLVGGCVAVTDPSPEPSTTTTASSASPEPTVEPTNTPTDGALATPTPPADEDLPGQESTGFPEVGTSLVIVGVSGQEILNLRIGPGIDFASVARLPGDTGLTATGHNRDVGSAGIWYQVRARDQVGWVLSKYAAETGAVRDVTDSFVPAPTATTRDDLIAAVVAAWDPNPNAEAVVVFGPVESEDLQFRVDVLTEDSSAIGARLFIVAAISSETYTVTRVTATQLCNNGVSGNGACL